MPTNVTFTDNNRMANSFVKELYIGSKWKGYGNDNDKMILDLARDSSFQPTGSLISLGLESTYNGTTGMADGFLVVNNDTSGPLKFDPKGKFQGVDCYMVVDWSAFSLPASQTDLIDGAICFWAEIDMEKATNINNSPTIKKYLYEQRMLNLAPEDVPPCYFDRQEWTAITSNHTEDVNDWDDFVQAVTNHNPVTINLTNDIAITDGRLRDQTQGVPFIGLVSFGYGKKVVIEGNNHKFFDYSNLITGATLVNGRYCVSYQNDVTGKETFITSAGVMHTLAKSNVYKARGWIVPNDNSNTYGLLLPDELSLMSQNPENHDNVFVCYRLSYHRYMRKITYLSQGALFFEAGGSEDCTNDEYYRNTLTPYTDFYLVNYDGDNEGIVIKGGNLYYPSELGNISQCLWDNVLYNRSTARIEINKLNVVGGLSNCIRNESEMRLCECDISNETGDGISNYGNLFVEGNTFHDIKGCALRMEILYYDNNGHGPYMEVTHNSFRNIGHYGTNTAAVWSSAKAYIAYNEFVDTNYCAVRIGGNGNLLSKTWRRNLVEHNFIHYTPEWITKRKQLGLQDSGDIYVVGNNEMAIIRFNRIIGAGGLGDSNPKRKNNGIYLDYWTYNVQVYGNVITGTENYYDIDCRDCSLEERNKIPNVLASGEYSTTNIFIGYNVCDGFVRIQENTVDVLDTSNDLDDSGCKFVNNFLLCKSIDPEVENDVATGNTYKGIAFCKDSDGIITDETGIVASATLIKLIDSCPILPELPSD